jgi:hypothetical protein
MSGSQWWPDTARPQWPGVVAMRKSVGGKDMNMEADESAMLRAIIKQCLVVPEKT